MYMICCARWVTLFTCSGGYFLCISDFFTRLHVAQLLQILLSDERQFQPVLFWKVIFGLKFPCFLFYAC